MAKLNKIDFENEYEEHTRNFNTLRSLLIKELEALLIENDVRLGFPIQSRIKSLNSIIDKHESQRYKIKKSLLELQDLIGIRVVLLFRRDIELVSSLIEQNFKVLSAYDPADKLNPDQFGYSSKHYIINIPESWTNVPTNRNLNAYMLEIQIRTLSQHNWAEMSNYFQYKNESNVPKEILRTIGRVSALLETVDLELERTLQERDNYVSKINISVDQNLNVEIMEVVFAKFLPEKYERDRENYANILDLLNKFNIRGIDDLINLIRNNTRFTDKGVKLRSGKSNSWMEHDNQQIKTATGVIVILLSYLDHKKFIDYLNSISII
jgi:putative GTP pyrophosphokinase